MMKIEEVVGDLILVVLDNHEPLAKIGIDQDKIFVYVNGYDENGMWICLLYTSPSPRDS